MAKVQLRTSTVRSEAPIGCGWQTSRYARSWEGWLYLAFVLDAYSRKVVGWSMANHLRTEVVLDALNMAIHNRCRAPGLVHHSDRGSQYTSVEFGDRLKEAELLALNRSQWKVL
jgi:transposase InsO family protein